MNAAAMVCIAAADAACVVASAAQAQSPAAPAAAPARMPPLVETLDADELRQRIAANLAAHRDEEADAAAPGVADLPSEQLRGLIEALLLVATRPLASDRLSNLLPGAHPAYVEGFMEGLAERFVHERRGWDLRRIAGGWQLLTRAEFHPWVRHLDRKDLPSHLSKSAMETLAIVAYKQPITRGAIEDIRGVQCGPMLRQLMDMKLVLVLGREDEALGRPILYGTTAHFLDRFGLGSLEDLPRRHEFGA